MLSSRHEDSYYHYMINIWPHTSTTTPAPGVMKFTILIDPPQLIITVNSVTQKAMVKEVAIYIQTLDHGLRRCSLA